MPAVIELSNAICEDDVASAMADIAAHASWHPHVTIEEIEDEEFVEVSGHQAVDVQALDELDEVDLRSEAERLEDEYYKAISVWDKISESFRTANRASSELGFAFLCW